MLNFLYMIFIYPVYMFVEFVFFLANNITDDYIGASIVLLSIIVNIICLPIYNVAETWQKKERDIQKKLKPKTKDIRAVFSGDERYMILSAYYRQNNYHPLYALRGIFPLLIQIPFFFAAYKLLSNLPLLNNASFWFLKDLGKPDQLLNIGGIYINFLPILMTIINISASAVYSKGLSLKEKIQLYLTAAVFLILLYNSPSGLVLYWTLNNLFSLLKNIFYRVRLDKRIWYAVTVLCFICFSIFVKIDDSKLRIKVIVYSLTSIVILLPIIWHFISKFLFKNIWNIFSDDRNKFFLFLQGSLAFFIFLGLVIPSSTIASSPLEFVNFENIANPFLVLFYSGVQSLGCLFWLVCLYKLFQKKTQTAFTLASIILLVISVLNAFVFRDGYGSINNLLVFSDAGKLRHSLSEILINLSIITVAGILVFIVLYFDSLRKYVSAALKIIIVSFFVITVISSVTIYREVKTMNLAAKSVSTPDKAYRVSKTGKNIFIFMLDRSMNFFIDPIFETSEIVKKEYTGFTLFENAIAFGSTTNFSTPSLFGGYEYTPENIDKRSDELLVDKHNEALSVLPRLFSENNWSVSFTDPSWLNYSWIPDLSVFSKYNIIAKNIDGNGLYTQDFLKTDTKVILKKDGISGIRRNMLYFSFFKILPLEARRIFYANGMYASVGLPIYSAPFFNAYSALENIEKEVEFVENQNCINIIVNNLTHEPSEPSTIKLAGKDFLIPIADNYCLNGYTSEHFYVNYLAHESCAKFFRFLKNNDCWNNSRIIIAGDHGNAPMRTKYTTYASKFDNLDFMPDILMPLIMMKDFNSEGALKKDNTFMTLADIPLLSTKGLPSELQKNPFTGKTFIETQDKKVVKAVMSGNWHANHQLKATQFDVDKDGWIYIKDNVYDPANWSRTNFNEE
ncbi:YidC/Oxa1 family membrane protein insertase [Treponema denticola]|uniref:YidC/Oxa1 family membrane protein insertase n=1 Tax=Treponema denticola H-22 TaxID=999432 RepID=A0A0E2EKD2_TREDN|nr:membrane protein insertase YidC [Treponema denticola]EMB36033.1 YidC/Oxa1 family membrane protein insertase [Treponema denticola H-22]